MSKAIYAKSVAVALDGAATYGQVELYLDDTGTPVDADFSVALHTGNTTIPFVGVDPKGIVTFRFDNETEGALAVDITATEADGTATTESTTPATLASLKAGDPLTNVQ